MHYTHTSVSMHFCDVLYLLVGCSHLMLPGNSGYCTLPVHRSHCHDNVHVFAPTNCLLVHVCLTDAAQGTLPVPQSYKHMDNP